MLVFFFISGTFASVFSSVSTTELFADSWSMKTSMTQARWGLGVIAVADKIYAIGGLSVDGYAGTNERYDPATDTWITLKAMPTPRINFGIVAYQEKIYCIGGSSYDKEGNLEVGKMTEVYDILTNSWATKAAYPYGSFGMDAHVVDGKIFVVSGYDLFMYDPSEDSWTKKSDMPELYRSIAVFGSVVLDDKIVLIDATNLDPGSKPKILFYDPKTDVWNKGQVDSLYGAFRGDAVVTTGRYAPQKIYALNLAVNNVYDPISDTWSTAESMPTDRVSFGIAVVDDLLYVIGGHMPLPYHGSFTGYMPGEPLAINEQYVPIGYSSATVGSEHSKPLSTYLIVAALAITTVTITAGVFFYFKKRNRKGDPM